MVKHYDINESLRSIGQYTCLVGMAGSLVGEVVGATTATIGLIKDDDKLFFTGVLMTGLSYFYSKVLAKFNNLIDKSRNKPNKLEQNLSN